MDKDQDIVERGPARAAPRDSLFLLTSLCTPEGMSLGKARVRNLSATGMMADCERRIVAKAKVLFELRGVGRVSGQVAWANGHRIGIAFDREIDPRLARRPVSKGGGNPVMPDYLRMHQLRRR